MSKEELKDLGANLWKSADTLRVNTGLKSSEYATPVLGFIFLKFAENVYKLHEGQILDEYEKLKGSRLWCSSHNLVHCVCENVKH